MLAWIESHQGLARHLKTKRLARKLGVTVPAAIGHLHLLWWWAMDNLPDGNLSAVEPEDIADEMMWDGDPEKLVSALVESGFVDKVDGSLFIHDWHDYIGKLIDKRKKDAERKRNDRRKSDGCPTDNMRTISGKSKGRTMDVTQDGAGNSTVPNLTINNNTTTGADVFRVFESEGFGTISSLLLDDITDAINTYSDKWVIEALRESAKSGKRNWKYALAILKRWKAEGIDMPWERGETNAKPWTSPARGRGEYDWLSQ